MRNRAKHYKMVRNAFCPTGAGGGVDPSCGSGGSVRSYNEIKSGINKGLRVVAIFKKGANGYASGEHGLAGKAMIPEGYTASDMIGFAAARPNKDGTYYIAQVHVDESHRRQGHATKMYNLLKEQGIKLGQSPIQTTLGDKFRRSYESRTTTNARKTKKSKRTSPLRFDPTRTTTLRRAFVARLRRGFARLRLAVVDLIERQDALGLREVKRVYNGYNPSSDIQKAGKWLSECGKAMPGYGQIFLDRKGSGGVWYVGGDGDERGFDIVVKKKLLEIEGIDEVRYESEYFPPRREDWVKVYPQQQTTTNERWRFHSDPDKLKQFQDWLKTQIKAFLVGMTEEELWTRYVEEGFKKGAGRAFEDVKPRVWGTPAQAEFYAGSKDQFLKSAFGRPESVGKVRLLASRSFDEMKGMTEDMTLKMGRALVDGLTRGANPNEIAGDLVKQVGLSRTRAETIAQTEIIRAHAEGQLQAFEEMGVDEIGVMVEWTVTEDEALCELCEAMQGVVLKIEEARGMIPRHPNCFVSPKVPIYTTEGWMPLGQVKVGHLVLTHKGRFRKVTQVHRNVGHDTKVITFKIDWGVNHRMTMTGEHPVLVNGEWKSAQDIVPGDKVRWMASSCLGCKADIPFGLKYCGVKCQWKNPEHRANVSKKNSEANLRQYASGERDGYETTYAAHRKVRELVRTGKFNYPRFNGFTTKIGRAKNRADKLGNNNPMRKYPVLAKFAGKQLQRFLVENPDKHANAIVAKKGHKTSIERLMGDALPRVGIDSAVFNHPVNGLWIDYALVDRKIAIECDGAYWHRDKERDAKRDQRLKDEGWTVIRFTEKAILANAKGCAEQVARLVNNHDKAYRFTEFEVTDVTHRVQSNLRLYNLSVDQDESFVAKGCVVHNCRCAFIPANVGEATDDQTRGKSKIVQAVKISARMGNDGFSTAVPVSKVRPTPPVPVTVNQHARQFSQTVKNAFCPTGPGGGQDNSCSPSSSGGSRDLPSPRRVDAEDADGVSILHQDVADDLKVSLNRITQAEQGHVSKRSHDKKEDRRILNALADRGLLVPGPVMRGLAFADRNEAKAYAESLMKSGHYRTRDSENDVPESFTEDPDIAKEFSTRLSRQVTGAGKRNAHGVVLEIDDGPKGSRGYSMAYGESEVILPRDQSYKVLDVTEERDGDHSTFRVRMKHDKTPKPTTNVYRPTPPVPVTTNVRRFSQLLRNAFCPTGVGGGQDNSCGGREGRMLHPNDLPTSERGQLRYYADTSALPVNRLLRGEPLDPRGPDKETVRENIATLDRVFSKSRTDRTISVHRKSATYDDVAVGQIIHEPGFLSTSRDAKGKSGDARGTMAVIIVPKGVGAVDLNTKDNPVSDRHWEREILLQRGLSLKVTRISQTRVKGQYGEDDWDKKIVHMTVVKNLPTTNARRGKKSKRASPQDALGLREVKRVVGNAFCPTGPGGGVDPSCSPSEAADLSSVASMTKKEFADKYWFHGQDEDDTHFGKQEIHGGVTKSFAESAVYAGLVYGKTGGQVRIVPHSTLSGKQLKRMGTTGSGHKIIDQLRDAPVKSLSVTIPTTETNPHEYLVRKALASGVDVPDRVLKDYPHLKRSR